MTLGVNAVIRVRGRSKSPWLLNYSHRTSGDLSVMVSVFLRVCQVVVVEKRRVKKMTLTLLSNLCYFENNCLSPLL